MRIDAQNERLARIEGTIDLQQQQLDFVVRANEKPEELLIPSGCVWDAYTFVCDLIRSAEKRITDDAVWLLGTSVKDMGRSLCTIIKVGFSAEQILNMVKS